MSKESTKEAAETLLRELPSVIGACVREDVHGHPREIHLLVRAGPNPRHLAYDVRDLLEERLGIPIDQRVISIAQLAPGKKPGPLLAGSAAAASIGSGPPDVDGAAGTDAGGASVEGADPTRPEGGTKSGEQTRAPTAEFADPAAAVAHPDSAIATAGTEPEQDETAPEEEAKEPRILFTGISTESIENRVKIRITLDLNGMEHAGEATGLDTSAARLRTCAAATLQAVDTTCAGRARFEVEQISTISAFERDYMLVTVMVSSPYLGRRPIALVGAQPVEVDGESAVALAALKAINRTLSLLLRLGDPVDAKPHPRARPG